MPDTAYLEVEAKLLVDSLENVESRLALLGAQANHVRQYERNVRYEDAARTLTPAGVVLRLREDDRVRLTYKGLTLDQAREGQQARFEAEVVVDDFATMDLILKRLGYTPYMVYEKYRTCYMLDGVEVMLDEMPYGMFVEVEGDPDRIEETITALGLTKCIRFQESYARLFHYVRANLKLAFQDLTFQNFANIEVPLEAFRKPEG